MFKKRLIFVLLMSLCFFLSGCNHRKREDNTFISDFFHCSKIDEENIAIGNLASDFDSNYIFIPSIIQGYTVKKLGYSTGLGFGGSGYLISYRPDQYELERLYCPNTIEIIGERYMYQINSRLDVFYCGEIVDLGEFNSDAINVYVPNEYYNNFKDNISNDYSCILKKANISYHLNYELENDYYYVDNYEYGTKIKYIPPIPQRDGYDFKGWYVDEECSKCWNFELDLLPELKEESYIETKLFAKWQKI